ncbi:hypothetical protein DL770_005630 [Monosporascus sp. CRB-9-2]|nr:hypothetical protein DL770_005630 [Monosporascus sp. CRB-9-2]
MAMSISGDFGDFGDFLNKFRLQNEEGLKWMTTFGEDFRRLADQHRDTCRDLERERVAGRHTQEQAELLGKRLRELEESVKRSSFVLVLIDADADAYLFDDGYFDDPVEGGKRAALALRSAVKKWWKAENPSLGDIPVVVKAFANGDGLAQLLLRAGMVKRDNALASFASSFSQADEMFDFVLVGKGKDRADHKITGALKHYVESPSCCHILFAACHDNGYVRTLEKYDREPSAAKKITLLRSFQTGREFSSLGLPSITFESVFRKDPLPEGNLVVSGKADDSVRAPSSVNSKTPSSTNGITQAPQGPSSYAQQVALLPSNGARPLPRFGTIGVDAVLVNDGGHRLDCPLPKASEIVAHAFGAKTKIDGKRYCNRYHLYGSCPGGCGYLHQRMTDAEKLVQRHRLRGQICHDRGHCRDPRCFYGHHCTCSQPGNCRFPANMHGVDVTTWKITSGVLKSSA